MTSYPPSDGGDQQRRPGDEGQSQGGSPHQPGRPDPYGQQPYPQQPYPGPEQQYPPQGYPQEGYPQQGYQQPYPPQGYGQPGYPPPAGYPQGGAYPGYPPPGYQGGPLDPADPLVATTFQQWFSKSFGVLARSWKALLLIQVAAYAVPFVLGLLVAGLAVIGTPPVVVALLGFIVLVVFVAALLIAQGASYYFVTQDAAGAPESVGDAVRFGASRALPLLGWGILAAIIVFVGFVLLVIPGIYLGVVLYVVACVVMYERDGIGRCFSLVNPRWFPTFGRLLLLFVGSAVYQGIISYVVISLLGDAEANPWTQPIVQVLSIPVALLAVGVAVVTYAELRHHEAPGQVTTARLSAELTQR